jgi:hypothetical protein
MACKSLALPLDAWQLVLGNFGTAEAMCVFDSLWEAGIFKGSNRLDTFWSVIVGTREHDTVDSMENMPDSEPFLDGKTRLVEMGVPMEKATEIMRDAHGSWEYAMRMLGWD